MGTVPEVDIFNSMALWVENQPWPVDSSTKAALIDLVDLQAISPLHLFSVVRKSGLYEDTEICDVLEKQLNIEQEEEEEEESNKSMRVHIDSQEEVEIAFEMKEFEEQDDEEEIPGRGQSKKSPALHGRTIMQWLRRRVSVSESSSKNI